MKKLPYCLAIASLISLTLELIPSRESFAQPIQRAPIYNAYDLIAEVNASRASNGLPVYNVNSILMQIAQSHSDYQASIGTTTHYGPDGARPFQRALAAGYPVAGDLSAGGFFSENIQSGSGLTPAGAVDAWLGDSLHRSTMLSPTLQDVGAGVAVSEGRTYYTLDAGSSSESTISYTPLAAGTGVGPGSKEFVQPIITSTPNEDGLIYHEVKAGQALWSIAIAYNTTIDAIKQLNKLTSNDIYEGQMLLVRSEANSTVTPPLSTSTVAFGVPVSTATKPATMIASSTSTPLPTPPATRSGSGVVVGIIIVVALLAASLGSWLSTRKPA